MFGFYNFFYFIVNEDIVNVTDSTASYVTKATVQPNININNSNAIIHQQGKSMKQLSNFYYQIKLFLNFKIYIFD